MRSSWLIVLALTGCGRVGFDEDEDTPIDAGTVVAALVPPASCQTQSWAALAFADPDVDLSVADTASGVTVVWVTRAGSSVYAANIDASWSVTGSPTGTLIKSGTYRRVSATVIDGTLITSEGGFGDFKIDVVPSDLSTASEQTCPIAELASAPPMLKAGPDRVAMITTDIGMTVIPFDAAFAAMSSQLSAPSNALPIGMAATTVGNTAEVVWSTATTCFIEQVLDMATGIGAQSALPCAAPRLASDGTNVALVFDAPDGVFLSMGAPMAVGPSAATLLAANANSSRIVYDGQRYWISYRDTNSQLVLGYLTPAGTFLSTLIATAVTPDAYSLALVNGAPWLFTATTSGLDGQQFCIPSS